MIKERWIGLRSYTEQDNNIYFGRSEESEILFRQVQRQDLSIVFGVSGIGKTSLINASLLPKLRGEEFLPVKFRFDFNKVEGHTNEMIKTFKESVARNGAELLEIEAPVDSENETLWEFFHRIEIWDKKNRLVVPVLILDQFEEIFTLGKERQDIEEMISQLADLIENQIPGSLLESLNRKNHSLKLPCERQDYKILISLREDFVPMLDRLKKRIPSLMKNRYPLQHLNGKQALEIILGPGSDIVDQSVAEKIIRFVSASRRKEEEDLEDFEIEAALLSVVCSELDFGRRKKKADKITLAQVEDQSSNILRGFYIRSFIGVSTETKEFVEDKLLTKTGFRCAVPMEDAAESGIQEEGIKELVESRILRIEERLGIPNIELSHDLLCQVVKESREERLREQLIKVERRKFKKKVLTGAVIIAVLLLIGNFSYKWWVGQHYERELAELTKQNIPVTYEDAFPDEKEILDIDNAANDLKAISQLLDDIPKLSSELDKILGLYYGSGEIKDKKTVLFDKLDSYSRNDYRLLSEEDKLKVKQIMGGSEVQRILELLIKASRKKAYLSEVNKKNLFSSLILSSAKLRESVKLLTFKAVLEAEKGKLPEAVDLFSTSLKLIEFVFSDRYLITHLQSIASIITTVTHFQVLLQKNNIDLETAKTFNQHFVTLLQERKKSLHKAFLLEFISGSQIYSKIITGETPVDEIFDGDGAPSISIEDVKEEHLFFLNNMNVYTQMAEYSYAELQRYPLDKFLKEAPKNVIIMRMILPSVTNMCIKSYEAQVVLQQSIIALELKAYYGENGKFPAQLKELKLDRSLLTDPFTEKNFQYKSDSKGFEILSPGHDGKEIIFTTAEK